MRASFEKKRGKLLTKRQEVISSDLSQSKSSLLQPDLAFKSNHKGTSIRKALQQAQVMLEEQRQAREDLEKKVTRLQMRGIERQKEFRRIIQQSIPFCLKEKSSSILSADLKYIREKLLSFFQATQDEVQKHMQQERQWIQLHMERRVQAITKYAEQQLQQHKRLQSLSYQKIHRQISTAINHSAAILTQNEQMKRQIKELTFKNSILKEERGLLIEQVLGKKNLILKMYGQLKEKYSKDDQIQKEIQILRKQRRGVEKLYANYEQNERKQIDGCFKTIQSIRPKAIQLFATDPVKEITPHKTINPPAKSQGKQGISTPQRFYSTIDVKARHVKASLHRTMATNQTEKDESALVAQLRQNLKREKRKSISKTQKIEYLVGYKREVDLFLRECYRKGELEHLNEQRMQNLLINLKKVIEQEGIGQVNNNQAHRKLTQKDLQEMFDEY